MVRYKSQILWEDLILTYTSMKIIDYIILVMKIESSQLPYIHTANTFYYLKPNFKKKMSKVHLQDILATKNFQRQLQQRVNRHNTLNVT